MRSVSLGFVSILGIAASGQYKVSYADQARPALCNFAKVAHVAPGRSAVVRSGAGMQFKKIDGLKDGTIVYVCDETEKWYEVFYSSGDDLCSTPATGGLLAEKARSCKSGWIAKSLVEIVSG
jgi:hypothetical protein